MVWRKKKYKFKKIFAKFEKLRKDAFIHWDIHKKKKKKKKNFNNIYFKYNFYFPHLKCDHVIKAWNYYNGNL